jgi:hypothetical protein
MLEIYFHAFAKCFGCGETVDPDRFTWLVTADVILPPGCCRKAEVEKRGPIHHSLIHSGSM